MNILPHFGLGENSQKEGAMAKKNKRKKLIAYGLVFSSDRRFENIFVPELESWGYEVKIDWIASVQRHVPFDKDTIAIIVWELPPMGFGSGVWATLFIYAQEQKIPLILAVNELDQFPESADKRDEFVKLAESYNMHVLSGPDKEGKVAGLKSFLEKID